MPWRLCHGFYVLLHLAWPGVGEYGEPGRGSCGSAVSVLDRLQQDGDTITLARFFGGGIEEEQIISLAYRNWRIPLARDEWYRGYQI